MTQGYSNIFRKTTPLSSKFITNNIEKPISCKTAAFHCLKLFVVWQTKCELMMCVMCVH